MDFSLAAIMLFKNGHLLFQNTVFNQNTQPNQLRTLLEISRKQKRWAGYLHKHEDKS